MGSLEPCVMRIALLNVCLKGGVDHRRHLCCRAARSGHCFERNWFNWPGSSSCRVYDIRTPRSVFPLKVVSLQYLTPATPARLPSAQVRLFREACQRVVVCHQLDLLLGPPLYDVLLHFDSVNDCQQFLVCGVIARFRWNIFAALIGDTFAILHENCSNTCLTGIRNALKWLRHVRCSKHWCLGKVWL